MSLISRLSEFFHPSAGPHDLPDNTEHLTVAALLTLIARADGRMLETEADGVHALLGTRFGLTREQARGLLARLDAMEAALDPSTTLVDRILHDIRFEERPRLLALAYRIAAIDGAVHEFEDDLIWRTGRLLGLSESELAAIKAEAASSFERGRAHG